MTHELEIRLLTEAAKRTRFDFVWTIEDADFIGPAGLLLLPAYETALRHALQNALGEHGVLYDHSWHRRGR